MCVCVCVCVILICPQLVEDRLAVTAATSVNNQVQWSVATPQLFSIQMSYEFSLFGINLILKKNICIYIRLVVRIGEYPPGREIFMLWKSVEKKEITLDQSKSLENVKVRKIRVARNTKKSNPEEHINKNECQFCLVKDSATEDQNTEHHVSNAQRRLQMARGLLHPRHQSLVGEKKMLGFLSLNPTLHTSFKHQKCCSAFGLLGILMTNPALIIKILYSLSFLPLHHQMPAWSRRHRTQVKGN